MDCNPLECLLKQLDYSPSFSMTDNKLGLASLTIGSWKTQVHSLIVKYNREAQSCYMVYK